MVAARRAEAKIFFADEAHFRADTDLRGKWALKGEPALADSTSPRRGEKVSYYSAVCLETGEVETVAASNTAISIDFLRLRKFPSNNVHNGWGSDDAFLPP